MKRVREWVLVAGLLAGHSTFGEEVVENQVSEHSATTNMMGAADLWAGMHEIGMIDAAQFQHVQEHGRLPGGTTVSNSPITAESQANWNQLAKQELITPDELAAMLFDGNIPGLSKEEERAFVELAPVYQPKRARRLTYESRRKHARVELIRLSHRLRKKGEAFEERARLLNIPMRSEEGVLMHIDEEGRPFYSKPSGMGSCDTISTDEVWGTNRVNAAGDTNTNFNLTGEGVTLAMWETGGIRETHQEFAGRVEDHVGAAWYHVNAVGAIMVGAGVTSEAQGMAPAATLHVYSYEYGQDPEHELTTVANYGAISASSSPPTTNMVHFSNHSYSTHSHLGYYNAEDEEFDRIVYEAYWHLPVWAVGNERDDDDNTENDKDYDTLNAGIAKNVLGVGAIKEREEGYAGTSNVVMTAMSGWGPTDDGRIKPDLVAGGFAKDIPHWNYDTSYYSLVEYATSFAAPAVTGSLGLLQELHERLSGTNSIPLLASTYKGIIIHTADEAGDAPGPDYRFGWGVMNTLSAAELMAENADWNSNPFIKELMLPDGEEVSFFVEADTNLPLRVTICWSDPPYKQTSGTTLVNDLDLRIIDPTGQTNFFPWVLDPTYGDYFDNRGNPATTGDNTLDNVEQVVITNTTEGTYKVLINHKGSLINDLEQVDGQELSIILSGLLPENIDTGMVFSFTTNGLPQFEITDFIGSVYEISNRNELIYSDWEEVPESPLNILHPPTEWIDLGISTNSVQFYKIKKAK